MKLFIVIVNYRVTDLTIDCLRSVAQEIGSVPETYVAVCENGTGDDSAERIRKAITLNGWDAWCSLTAINPNLGFTGGNNIIIRPALQSAERPQYVLLLNADTLVRPNAFRALVDFMDKHPKVGIAGSRLEDPDGTPQRSAFRFHSPLSEFERGIRLKPVSQLLNRWVTAPPVRNQTFKTDWVSGASMIIRQEVFRDIGLLDEGYYTYFDDIDFCFNARKAGWSTWYVSESCVVHLIGRTTGITQENTQRRPSYWFEARRRYFLKNYGSLYSAIVDAVMILGLVCWRLRVLLGKPDSTPSNYLYDHIKNSVFLTGFQLRDVQNPALVTPAAKDSVPEPSPPLHVAHNSES